MIMYSVAPITVGRSTDTPLPTPVHAFSPFCMQNDQTQNEQIQDQYSNNDPTTEEEQDQDHHSILVPQGEQNRQEEEDEEDEGEGRRIRQRVSQGQQQLQQQVETRESTQGGTTHKQQTGVSSVQQNQQGEGEEQGQELGGQRNAEQQERVEGYDVEDRMSASMNPNQINVHGEVEQQNQQPQAFHYYPPFPPMVGTMQYPFIFQQMFNPPNNDIVLGVPVPPWIINPPPSSSLDPTQQPPPIPNPPPPPPPQNQPLHDQDQPLAPADEVSQHDDVNNDDEQS